MTTEGKENGIASSKDERKPKSDEHMEEPFIN